jgi:hypothetical protein
MQHLDEGTIHSWLDGALSADEAARVEAHVAECPQCAAAVAEARGFIAASSRILTALDHVPRGVVPAAAPARWSNRAVWRAAAAVLVVAAGSLVVFRNGGNDTRLATAAADSSRSGAKLTLDTGSIRAAPTGVAAPEPAALLQKTPPAMTPRSTYSGKATAVVPQSNIPVRENRKAAEQADRAVAEGNAAPSAYTGGAAATPQTSAPSRVGGVSVMDATGEPVPLKVVRVEPIIGGTRTLYEVSPSDTVILIEPQQTRLEQVGVAGAVGAVTAQSVEKSAAVRQRARVDAAVISTPDSQQASAQAARAAPTMLAPRAAPQPTTGLASSIHTIRWTDATTGKMLTLSGRLPEAQLQQIRFRIERERAIAAAKKKP